MRSAIRFLIIIIVLCFGAGCANIVPPEGGKKDTTPPKLVSVSPADSLLNTRVSKIDLRFNEYVELNNASAEVQVSPLLPFPPTVSLNGRHVTVSIPDSVLMDNTTYRVSMNNAIKDLREGNPFPPYTYVFSTGSYFDSLQLGGIVYDAATGMPDSSSLILVYSAAKSDSVVVQEKPLYIGKVTTGGHFEVKGLPGKRFRIYALHDANKNLTYDGGEEMIGFVDSIVVPIDSIAQPIILKVFKEVMPPDSIQSVSQRPAAGKQRRNRDTEKDIWSYGVALDTSDINKRTVEIIEPIKITLSRAADTLNPQRIFLSYDSSGVAVEAAFTLKSDTVKPEQLLLNSNWKEDMVYTLRLLKGFAKDSAGNELMPSKYIFRTKNDDDYGKLSINIPLKYKSPEYLFMVTGDADTIYNRQITDTVVRLIRIKPGNYRLRIIVDKNRNGKWDTGDLFEKRQPENVIPYTDVLQVKAGWDNTIDFEKLEKGKKSKAANSPGKREQTPDK